MNSYLEYGIALLLVTLCFTVVLTLSTPFPWISRGLILLFLASGGLLLSLPLAVSAGILTIPADLLLITWSTLPQKLNSTDFLIWALYIGVPLLVSQYKENRPEPDDTKAESESDESGHPGPVAPEETPGNVEFHPEVSDDTDPSDQIQDLLVNRFRTAHREFDTDNLVYFHVRENEARPGYVVNDHGQIDTEMGIGKDQARGVGWVLRHEDQLLQEGDQVDWRSLQYHKSPVDLQKVLMKPILDDQRMIGILVLEWKESEDYEQQELQSFLDEIEKMMAIDHSVRNLERKEREINLLKTLSDLEPLSTERMETLRQRIKDLVSDLIPAGHVEYVTPEGQRDDKVLQQRQLFYDQCCEWIESQNSVLRINDVDDFSVKGRRFGKIAPPDVTSFMGGPLRKDGQLYGFLCLDDTEEGFFTPEDEKLLKLLLDQSAGFMKAARELTDLKTDREQLQVWLDAVDNLDFSEPSPSVLPQLVEAITNVLPIAGAGFYVRSGDGYELMAHEDVTLPEAIQRDSSLVTRLRDCRDQLFVNVPNLRRLQSFSRYDENWQLAVAPVFNAEEDLYGFCCLFFEEDLPEDLLDQFETVWSLLERELGLLFEREELRADLTEDEWTELPEYGPWKKAFGSVLSGEDLDRITVWALRVPGFESVAAHRGRQRALKWIRSITNRLKDDFSEETFTRSHSSFFLGFSSASEASVRSSLEDVARDIRGWSFPSGQGSVDPSSAVASFQEPYPDVGAMIESLRKELLTSDKNDEERKETSPQSG